MEHCDDDKKFKQQPNESDHLTLNKWFEKEIRSSKDKDKDNEDLTAVIQEYENAEDKYGYVLGLVRSHEVCDMHDKYNESILHEAAWYNKVEIVQLMCLHMDVNVVNTNHSIPLHHQGMVTSKLHNYCSTMVQIHC